MNRRKEERRIEVETPDEFKRTGHVRRTRKRRYHTRPHSSAELERRTSNADVEGSNPSGGANDQKDE
jgi:hypothetical protein